MELVDDQNPSYESDISVQFIEKSQPEGTNNSKSDSGGPVLNLANDAKKQKKWGPIEATRNCDRINVNGKIVLEIAQELKKKKYLEIPRKYHSKLQGIISKKPFSIDQQDKLINNALDIGVVINDKCESGL